MKQGKWDHPTHIKTSHSHTWWLEVKSKFWRQPEKKKKKTIFIQKDKDKNYRSYHKSGTPKGNVVAYL